MKIKVLHELDKLDRNALKQFMGKKEVQFEDYRKAIREILQDKIHEILKRDQDTNPPRT